MSDDYGKKVGNAIRAVHQLHSDSSRLLLDLDRIMHGWQCLYGAYVTNDIPSTVGRGRFMAEGLYRHYTISQHPTIAVAVNLCFFDSSNLTLLNEPLFVAAELRYEAVPPVKDYERAWDPWSAFLGWNKGANIGELVIVESPETVRRKLVARLMAVPLYEITGSDYVRELLLKVCTVPLPGS